MNLSAEIHQACGQIAGILDRLGIPYAIGGAVAMAFAGHIRGTHDLDLLANVPALRYQDLADALQEAGFTMRDEEDRSVPIEVPLMLQQSRELGHFRIWWKNTRTEIFSPRVPLQDAILRRRVQVNVEDLALWVTTVEDLVLLKMIFHRSKDIEDVRRLLAANRGWMDEAYIRTWIPRTLQASVGEELQRMLLCFQDPAPSDRPTTDL